MKIELINLLSDGYHVMARVGLNGEMVNMLIDTGASKTVLDRHEIMERFPLLGITSRDELSTGLGTNSMQSYSTQIPIMELGALRIENLEIALLDLSHIQNAYQSMGLEPLSGVIGNDILVPYQAIIHYPKKRIHLFKPA